jgi:hypothetical protein
MRTTLIRLMLIATLYVVFKYIIFSDHTASLLSAFVFCYIFERIIEEKFNH